MSLWKLLKGRWGTATETDDVRIDAMTNALYTVDYSHHEIHNGCTFSLQASDQAMNDNDDIIIAFKTAAGTKRAHMLFGFSTLVGGDIQVLEAPTWTSSSGAKGTIRNHKRLASMTASTLLEDSTGSFVADGVVIQPTGLSGGTELVRLWAWGKKDKIGAGSAHDSEEWILKPDTQYAIVFTAEGGNNKAQITIDWYEHTDTH